MAINPRPHNDLASRDVVGNEKQVVLEESTSPPPTPLKHTHIHLLLIFVRILYSLTFITHKLNNYIPNPKGLKQTRRYDILSETDIILPPHTWQIAVLSGRGCQIVCHGKLQKLTPKFHCQKAMWRWGCQMLFAFIRILNGHTRR